MLEGVPSEAEKITTEQIDELRYFKENDGVVGLALGGSEPEKGWKFIGYSKITGLVSLYKVGAEGDTTTRDIEVDEFLRLNSENQG